MEILRIKPDALILGRRIFGKGNALRFTFQGMQELKKTEVNKSSASNIIKSVDLFTPANKISLQYFGKEYSFGNDLSEEDTGELFALLKREIRKIKKD